MAYDTVAEKITKKEVQLHCRRTTRGAEETTRLLQCLIDTLRGEGGNNTLGIPLFATEALDSEWNKLKKHVKCIQVIHVQGLSIPW